MALSKSEAGHLGHAASAEIIEIRKQARIAAYNANPKRCRLCDTVIPREKRRNDFCSQSCGAKWNNRIDVAPKRTRTRNYVCFYCQQPTNGSPYCSSTCSQGAQLQESDQKIESGEKVHQATLRRYLIRKFGNRCLSPTCRWDHDSQPVCVELEHKDGNSENNDLANLTLLCPNCHSLTPTYKAKNRGNGRYLRRMRYAAGKSS